MRLSLSLKAKLALAGGLAIAVCVWLLTTVMITAMETDIRRTIEDSQMALIGEKGETLDDKIRAARNAITQNAVVLSGRHQWPSQAELTEHFQSKPVLRGMFDALLIIDEHGRLMFDSPPVPGRVGLDLSDREYVRRVLETGEPMMAHPVRARTNGDPVVLMAAPIRDAGSRVVGVLVGALDLEGNTFLARLRQERIGRTGYYAIVSKESSPVVVVHPHTERLLTPAPVAEHNLHLAAALRGRDGSVEGVNSVGLKAIFSYKSLQSAPWVLVAAYPAEEAYAALQTSERELRWLAALLGLGGCLVFFAVSDWLLRPLYRLRQAIEGNAAQPSGQVEVAVQGSPEIVAVSRAYNQFIDSLRRHQEALQTSEERIRSILSNAPDAFVSIDAASRITEWNRQAEMTFGWQRDEVLGRSLAEVVIPPAHRDAHMAGMSRFVSTGTGPVVNQRVEVTALHRDGREIPIELSVAAVRDGGHYVAHAFMRDISERRAAQAKLAASKKLLLDITDNLPVLISYIDGQERLQFCNGTFRRWLGVDPQAVVGRPLLEVIGPELHEQRRTQLALALSGQRVDFETTSEALGKRRHLQTVYVPDVQPDGRVAGIYTISTDVTALKKVEQQLQQLARYDALTGLPNRLQFDEKLQEALARCRRTARPMAVLFLDVDKFKTINDTWGHAGGDEVLKEFALRLTACVRATDTVARLAGDEFVVILEGLNHAEEPAVVARKILAGIARPFSVLGESLAVSTSVGIAVSCAGAEAPAALLAQADQALYESKAAGRDTFRQYVAPGGAATAGSPATAA